MTIRLSIGVAASAAWRTVAMKFRSARRSPSERIVVSTKLMTGQLSPQNHAYEGITKELRRFEPDTLRACSLKY